MVQAMCRRSQDHDEPRATRDSRSHRSPSRWHDPALRMNTPRQPRTQRESSRTTPETAWGSFRAEGSRSESSGLGRPSTSPPRDERPAAPIRRSRLPSVLPSHPTSPSGHYLSSARHHSPRITGLSRSGPTRSPHQPVGCQSASCRYSRKASMQPRSLARSRAARVTCRRREPRRGCNA